MLAETTQRIRIRAGSVVMPLHHPIRVAEEWAVVDNLSRGRVDLSFAIGWNPNDFVIAPEHFAERKRVTHEGIDRVRRLWRGEEIETPNGLRYTRNGNFEVRADGTLTTRDGMPVLGVENKKKEPYIKLRPGQIEVGADGTVSVDKTHVGELSRNLDLLRPGRHRAGSSLWDRSHAFTSRTHPREWCGRKNPSRLVQNHGSLDISSGA